MTITASRMIAAQRPAPRASAMLRRNGSPKQNSVLPWTTTARPPAHNGIERAPAGSVLRRCGGKTCPPGTCDHDQELRPDDAGKEHGTQAVLRSEASAPLAIGSALAGMPTMAPPIVHDVIESPGSPLDQATRSSFEPRFGRDLSDVRLHAGDCAAASARAVGAVAYAVGPHIVFGPGSPAAGTAEGRRLLVHELTHVVQWPGTGVPARGALPIGGADSPLEKEAAAEAAGFGEMASQQPPIGVVTVRRQTADPSPGGVALVSTASCGWTGASDVSSELSRRTPSSARRCQPSALPATPICTGFLQRWLQSTACIETAQPLWFANDKTLMPRAQAQYVAAVKLILLHAENALGQPMGNLVAPEYPVDTPGRA